VVHPLARQVLGLEDLAPQGTQEGDA